MQRQNRFDKFDEDARHALSYAQEEAARRDHNYIGTEHLLLGLLHDKYSAASLMLKSIGVTPEEVRTAVESLMNERKPATTSEIGLTASAKKVIELAVDEARRLNHHYIGTLHLLFGIVREGENRAARVLAEHGASAQRLGIPTELVGKDAPPSASEPPRIPTSPKERMQRLMEQQKVPPDQLLKRPVPFDKFTQSARKTLALAHEEAQRFQHNYIGTEHLLLGLIRNRESAAGTVFAELGVELDHVRRSVEFIIGRGDRIVLGEVGLTPRAKKVVELAVDEAQRLGQQAISTIHLLLGMIREGEGIAAGVLESIGVELANARAAAQKAIEEGASEE